MRRTSVNTTSVKPGQTARQRALLQRLDAATSEPMCSALQRDMIRRLFSRNELPARRFVLLHRIPFARAGLSDPPVECPVEPHLDSLTFAQASALIVALRLQAGLPAGGDDDDD